MMSMALNTMMGLSYFNTSSQHLSIQDPVTGSTGLKAGHYRMLDL